MSLWSTVLMNSLCSLWKRATFVKLKVNASLMRGFAGSAVLFSNIVCLERWVRKLNLLSRALEQSRRLAFIPYFKAAWAFLRKNPMGATHGCPEQYGFLYTHQHMQAIQRGKHFSYANLLATYRQSKCLTGIFTVYSNVRGATLSWVRGYVSQLTWSTGSAEREAVIRLVEECPLQNTYTLIGHQETLTS